MTPEQEERIKRVLARTYHGIHHVDGWRKRVAWGDGLKVVVPNGLSTFDFDGLTRLVVAAHDEAVRVEILHGAPHRLVLSFHCREREGRMFERHPTLEEALVKMGRGT